MAELTGMDWTLSQDKIAVDTRYRERLRVVAEGVQGLGAWSLAHHFPAGVDPIFRHPRIGTGDDRTDSFEMPKLRTWEAADHSLDSKTNGEGNKNSVHIVSPWAKLMRDLCIDEAPQIALLGPDQSVVGPRSFPETVLECFLGRVARIDKGLARDYEAFYRQPGVRRGLTGPGQLSYIWSNSREASVLVPFMRADLNYYLTDMCSETGDQAYIRKTLPYVLASTMWKRRRLLVKQAIKLVR